MRRFRFPLRPLLRLRSQLERQARRAMATAMGDVAAVERKLQNVVQGIADCGQQARGSDAVGMLARALEDSLRRQQLRLQTEGRRVQAVLDRARTEYLTAQRELRTIERLREQRHEAWRDEVQRAEQAELDELARLGRLTAERREETR